MKRGRPVTKKINQDELLALLNCGYSVSRLADFYNVDRQLIYYNLNKWGITLAKKVWEVKHG